MCYCWVNNSVLFRKEYQIRRKKICKKYRFQYSEALSPISFPHRRQRKSDIIRFKIKTIIAAWYWVRTCFYEPHSFRSSKTRPDKRRVAGTKHTTKRNTLLLKSFCVTRVGEHESIDYINFVTNNTKCRETGLDVKSCDRAVVPL